MDSNKFLSDYPISRDSKIEIRLRSRAGQEVTFDNVFPDNDTTGLFHYVPLPMLLKSWNNPHTTSAKFFSPRAAYNLRKVLMSVTMWHREGLSFNGLFDSSDILFQAGGVRIRDTIAKVNFDEKTCAEDYKKLHSIFTAKFSQHGYPLYFSHLLDYLKNCPDKASSNTEGILAFINNHPCFQSHADRIKQIMLLDNELFRHFPDLKKIVAAMGNFRGWRRKICAVPEMNRIYRAKVVDLSGKPVVNHLYTDGPRGYLHYANNYMKHANFLVGIIFYCFYFWWEYYCI